MDFIFHEAELEERKERCQEKIMRYAAAGAVNGLNPVPGINVGIDAGICLKMMSDFREEFRLTDEARIRLQSYELLLPLVKAVFGRATQAGVTFLLREVLKNTANHSLLPLIPVVGQGISAALGFAAIQKLGGSYLEDCYQLAKEAQRLNIVDAEYEDEK